jgi:hypothetical protein
MASMSETTTRPSTGENHLLNAEGIAEFKAYLAGPPNRASTLAGNWPITLAEIARPAEFRQQLPHGTTEKRIPMRFPRLVRQLHVIAAEFGKFLQPLSRGGLIMEQDTVKPGRLHFDGWHIDGAVLVPGANGMKEFHTSAAELYFSDIDFAPSTIFLHATFELPPKFAAQVASAFAKNIFKAVKSQDKQELRMFNEAALDAWLIKNAKMNIGPKGKIIAFPSCVLHSSVRAICDTERTVVIASLQRRTPVQFRQTAGGANKL